MSDYVKTDTVLDKILAHKQTEITAARQQRPLAHLQAHATTAPPPRNVIAALRRETVALIAEVKHASPSRGVLIDPFRPVELAQTYAANGAAMISVLTDERFFQGHLDHLRRIRAAVDVPLLRKEFIIDPYQVYEARAAGADAVLLIAAALTDAHLRDLHALITHLGMTPLVEVHNAAELDRALKINPVLVGVNNRDLKTFEVDLNTTAQLAQQIPPSMTLIAESGMLNTADVAKMGELGAHAVLIGEGLVTAPDTAAAVREFSTQERRL